MKSAGAAVARPVRTEADDLVLLAIAALVVPLVWLLWLGWRPGLSMAGHDGLAQMLVLAAKLREAGGDWARLAYRADVLGGTALRDSFGPMPTFSLFTRAGLGPTAVLNASSTIALVLHAFLGVRAALGVAWTWSAAARGTGSGSTPPVEAPRGFEGIALSAAGAALFAFAPWIGWRLGSGGINYVLGALAPVAALGLVASAATPGATTVTLVAVSAIAVPLAILTVGQQALIYGATFTGAAVAVIAIGAARRGRWMGLAAAVLALVGAVLLTLPGLLPMLHHATSADAPRSTGGPAVVYSYLTAAPADWIGSFTWMRSAVPSSRARGTEHEVNYPLGPLIVLLALVPWRRAYPLGIAVLAGAIAAVALAMDARPVSTALLAAVPPLGIFRVPSRAVVHVISVVMVLGLAAVIARSRAAGPTNAVAPPPRRSKRKDEEARRRDWFPRGPDLVAIAAGALVGAALPLLSSAFRETAAWAAAGLLAWRLGPWRAVDTGGSPRRAGAGAIAAALALMLAGASIGAFRERLFPVVPGDQLLDRARAIAEATRNARPPLASALERVRLGVVIPELTLNTAFAGGLSSADGYMPAPRAFLELFFALQGQRYEPTAVFLEVTGSGVPGDVMRTLFNVGWTVETAAGGNARSLELQPLGDTAGGAWFPRKVETVASMADLAARLRAHAGSGGLARAVRETALVVGTPVPAPVSNDCDAARVIEARSDGVETTVRVDTPADCLLVIAMNDLHLLRASVRTADGADRTAPTVRVYGTLLGVRVPAGAAAVVVRPRDNGGTGARVAAIAGALAVFGAAVLVRRERTALAVPA